MKNELKVKFINHLNHRSCSEIGFTLIELLVVIIIVGILAAIALPNFINQTAKAKQTEAKQIIGVINRSQTAYRSENQTFASQFDTLATGNLTGGANTSTSNYSYTLVGQPNFATITAASRDSALKAYSGANVYYINNASQSVISSNVCEALLPGSGSVSAPATSTNLAPTCGAGYNTL